MKNDFHSLNLTSIWHRKQLSKCDLGIKHCHLDKSDVPHMKPEFLRYETRREVYVHLWIFPYQYYFFNNIKKDETRGFQEKKSNEKFHTHPSDIIFCSVTAVDTDVFKM